MVIMLLVDFRVILFMKHRLKEMPFVSLFSIIYLVLHNYVIIMTEEYYISGLRNKYYFTSPAP